MEGPIADSLFGLLGVAFFVLLNAFFVAAEFGLVSVRPTRVEELVEEGNATAVVVQHIIADPGHFIAAIQLGVTLSSLALGWIGEPALADLLSTTILAFLPEQWAGAAAHSLAATITFILITYFLVVIGELMPKSIALRHPEQTALFVARPTEMAMLLFRPAIWVLNSTSNALLRLIGIRPADGHEHVHSVQELRMLIESSQEEGVLEEQEEDMLKAIFDLRALRAEQVMVPRTEMLCVPATATLRELAELAAQTSLTKFPVFEADLDNIIGVLHVKDMVRPMYEGHKEANARALMRETLFLPETVTVPDLLATMRHARQHIAILLDEYGGTAGLVTLEDLLEEIVGEVRDVFDHNAPLIQQLPDGSVLLDGLLQIEEVNEALQLSMKDPYYTTLGGLVMGRLDRVPTVGDQVTLPGQGIQLRVEKMDRLRVARLRLTRMLPTSSPSITSSEERNDRDPGS